MRLDRRLAHVEVAGDLGVRQTPGDGGQDLQLALADRRTDTVEALPRGNQQRMQLIAALLHDPELLVLDEPFNGLDPIGAETMARVLRERAAAGTAVLFSSHQLDVVEDLCEDVAIIDKGRIVLSGDVRELKASSNRRVLEAEAGAVGGDLLDNLDGVLSSTFDGHGTCRTRPVRHAGPERRGGTRACAVGQRTGAGDAA